MLFLIQMKCDMYVNAEDQAAAEALVEELELDDLDICDFEILNVGES